MPNTSSKTFSPSIRQRHMAVALVAWLALGCAHQPTTPVQWPPPQTEASKQQSPWILHGTGVGELIPGAPISESVYAREGKSFDQLWTHPKRGLDQMEVAIQGFRDQEGYPLVKFAKLDVVARLTQNRTLLGIWVGPSVRTKQGTGEGSTRAELEAAHGALTQNNIPEPYHCVVGTSDLNHVAFLFKAHCKDVQADTPCAAVYVGGYDDPEME
jgi:hypothetical protein